MYKRTGCWLVWICFSIGISSCHKDVPQGKLEQGQIAFTFDDASVENWRQYLPLLDSLGIKATFYISSYHTFHAQKKTWLKEIEKHGHEIAYHTASHPDLVKEVTKNGMSQTEATEITADLQLMKADGFTITNFAYPFGSHNAQLNTCLLRTFKSVRALSNQQNYNKSLVKESGDWKVLYGADVDNNSRLTDDKILSLMDDAQLHNDCLVIVAHQINNKAIKLQISRERILLIAKAAKERNLKFINVNQIAN
ncbi:MAG: polysaccharide deacetylase family protein [Bacteroidota bacterium]|nr:polysaccharide deacetylase family protein [Bacteroidota bacterium]